MAQVSPVRMRHHRIECVALDQVVDLADAERGVLVCGLALDPSRVEAGLRRLFSALPEQAQRELEHELSRELGRELEREGLDPAQLIASLRELGPDLVLGVTMPAFQMGVPQMPRILLACRAPGDPKLADWIADRCAEAGGQVRSQEVDGRTLRWMGVEGAPVNVSIAFAQSEGRLLVASDLRFLKERLRGDLAGLVLDTSTAGQGCVAGSAAWAWLRVRDNFGKLWEELSPQVENLIASSDQLPIGAEDLPTPEELHGALRDVAIGVGVDAGGVSLRLISPLGGSTFLAVFGAMLDEAISGGRRRTG